MSELGDRRRVTETFFGLRIAEYELEMQHNRALHDRLCRTLCVRGVSREESYSIDLDSTETDIGKWKVNLNNSQHDVDYQGSVGDLHYNRWGLMLTDIIWVELCMGDIEEGYDGYLTDDAKLVVGCSPRGSNMHQTNDTIPAEQVVHLGSDELGKLLVDPMIFPELYDEDRTGVPEDFDV